MQTITAPDKCPSCGHVLEWENQLLYCRNPACGDQSSKKIEHFGKTLKIKGLGPATIESLALESIFAQVSGFLIRLTICPLNPLYFVGSGGLVFLMYSIRSLVICAWRASREVAKLQEIFLHLGWPLAS